MSIEKIHAADGLVAIIPQRVNHRYTVAELLARCDPNLPLTDEEQAWLDALAVGLEAFAPAAAQP